MSDTVNVTIERVGIEAGEAVLAMVLALLRELGEEGDEAGELDVPAVLSAWREAGQRFQVFVARADSGEVVGLATVGEAFAIYAGGWYGVINEMYVTPAHRGGGVGARLIEDVARYGRDRGWSRVDVTAPESERWDRTRRFYERAGFVFTGPKLKRLLPPR